jgi:hypothetical protein
MDYLQVGAGCGLPFGEPWPLQKITRGKDRRSTFVIGLGHEAEQGKDTLAAHLIDSFGKRKEGKWGKNFPIDIRRYAFGDALKVEVFDFLESLRFTQVYGFTAPMVTPLTPDLKKSECQDSFYLPLPQIGSGGLTEEQKIAWVNHHKEELRKLLQFWGTEFRRGQYAKYWVSKIENKIEVDQPQVAIITDMRFLNETEICDTQIRLVRPNFENKAKGHASESELDTFAYPWTIVGESVEDLKKKGEELVRGILRNAGVLSF